MEYKPSEKERLLKKYFRSCEDMKVFCKAEGIRVQDLNNWIRYGVRNTNSQGSFIKLEPDLEVNPIVHEIHFPNGVVLKTKHSEISFLSTLINSYPNVESK